MVTAMPENKDTFYTKAQIATVYDVQERTVSNWLKRARADHGLDFPGNYEGSALAFTEDQVDILLTYAGNIDKKVAEPSVTVMPPEVQDTGDLEVALSSPGHKVKEVAPIVHIHVHAQPIGRSVYDTTSIEADTERYTAMTHGHTNHLFDAIAGRMIGKVQSVIARQDNVIAGLEALATAKAAEVISQAD
jgi:hypothetical protein